MVCPRSSLFSRDPNPLDPFSLTLTMVKHHADRNIHRYANKEVYIPGYTE